MEGEAVRMSSAVLSSGTQDTQTAAPLLPRPTSSTSARPRSAVAPAAAAAQAGDRPATSGVTSTAELDVNVDGSAASGQAPEPDAAAELLDLERATKAKPGYWARVWEVFVNFFPLGFVSFGGPQANISLLEQQYVQKRGWLDADTFIECYSIAQLLPGPSASQMMIVVGAMRAGWLGGLIAALCFQVPMALVLGVAGAASGKFVTASFLQSPYLRHAIMGLTSSAVSLIAASSYSISLRSCKDRLTWGLCVAAAVGAIYGATTFWSFPLIMAGAGLVTLVHGTIKARGPAPAPGPAAEQKQGPKAAEAASLGMGPLAGYLLLALYAVLLLAALVARRAVPNPSRALEIFEAFFRMGSITYGGAQVVIPMLLAETAAWVSPEQFNAGFAFVQALPGPNFNFSAYLGAISFGGTPDGIDLARATAGAVLAWAALFAPGMLLMFAALPFYTRFRKSAAVRRVMVGVNAGSVGLIVAVTFQLWARGLYAALNTSNSAFMAISIVAFAAVAYYKAPSWAVVLGGGVLGLLSAFLPRSLDIKPAGLCP